MRRYLTVVGVILLVLLGLAVWLKPPLEKMRAGVEEELAAYAKAHGEAAAAPTDVQSRDWLVAASYSAKLGGHTFFCLGAFKVTFCQSPD